VIRRAASPLTETPVFLRIPQSLLSEFADDYEPDPILGTIVGIAVDHVEPTSGRTQSPGRLTISAMDEPV
jgi:hypothetical protein